MNWFQLFSAPFLQRKWLYTILSLYHAHVSNTLNPYKHVCMKCIICNWKTPEIHAINLLSYCAIDWNLNWTVRKYIFCIRTKSNMHLHYIGTQWNSFVWLIAHVRWINLKSTILLVLQKIFIRFFWLRKFSYATRIIRWYVIAHDILYDFVP